MCVIRYVCYHVNWLDRTIDEKVNIINEVTNCGKTKYEIANQFNIQ